MSQNEQNKEPQIVKKVRGRPKKAVTEKVKLVEEKSIDPIVKERKKRAKTESVKEKVVKEKIIKPVKEKVVKEKVVKEKIVKEKIIKEKVKEKVVKTKKVKESTKTNKTKTKKNKKISVNVLEKLKEDYESNQCGLPENRYNKNNLCNTILHEKENLEKKYLE